MSGEAELSADRLEKEIGAAWAALEKGQARILLMEARNLILKAKDQAGERDYVGAAMSLLIADRLIAMSKR